MLFTLTAVDISTVSLRQQTINGSCLVLDDKGLNSDRNQAVYWIRVISSWSLILVATVLGLPGNVLSAVVFYRQGLREIINLCLFVLAIVNFIVVLEQFLKAAESLYRDFVQSSWVFYQFTACLEGFTWASQFLSAVIASERCFCVVSPFHAKRLLKTSTMAAIIVVCCGLLTGGMSFITCSKQTPGCFFDPNTNAIQVLDYLTEYYVRNKVIIDIFDIFVYSTALPGIFLVVIIVTNCITAVTLRAALAWRLTTTSNSTAVTATTSTGEEEERKMTSKDVSLSLMLMATSVLFTVCMTANFILQISLYAVRDLNFDGPNLRLISSVWGIVYFLWVLNSSVNFVVYYKLGSNFRESINDLFGRKRWRKCF